MTKKEMYEMIGDIIDVIIGMLMLVFVKNVLTGTVYDIIINGIVILFIIVTELLTKFVVKANNDIED